MGVSHSFFSCLEKLASVYFKCQEYKKFLGRILMVLLTRKDAFICVKLAMTYMDVLSCIVNMPLFIVNVTAESMWQRTMLGFVILMNHQS